MSTTTAAAAPHGTEAGLDYKDFATGDRYVQHWDVTRPVPEAAANDNGMC
ncbi:hypothetical protein [Actinomadura sp. NTSP31]